MIKLAQERPDLETDTLVLDPETWSEQALNFFCLVGVAMSGWAGIACFEGGLVALPWPVLLSGLAILLFGGWLRLNLDEHYAVDFEAGEVRFRRSFGSRVIQQTTVSRIDELRGLVLTSRRHLHRFEPVWYYGLDLYTGNGRLAVNTALSRDYSDVHERGLQAAVKLKIPYHDAGPERLVRVSQRAGSLDVSFREHSFPDLMVYLGKVAATVLLLFAVMASLVALLSGLL